MDIVLYFILGIGVVACCYMLYMLIEGKRLIEEWKEEEENKWLD